MKDERAGTLLVLGSTLFIGTFPVLGKFAVESIDPLLLGVGYSVVAALVLSAYLGIRGGLEKVFRREYVPRLAVIGFFAITYTTLLFFFGARLTSGINSALLLEIEAFYALVIGYIFLNEMVTRKQIAATSLIVLGAAAVLYNGNLAVRAGDLMILAVPFGWQIANVLAKRLKDELDPYVLSTGRVFYGSLFLLVTYVLFGSGDVTPLYTSRNLLTVLFLGLIPTAGGIVLWHKGLEKINLSKATPLLAPYPLVSVVLAWPLLGEIPSPFQVLGLVLMILGLYSMAQIPSRHREPER